MSVYIDALMACLPNHTWRWSQGCHLVADTEDELHDFARRIGLRKAWHQASPPHSISHYDLNAGRRKAAVAAGAVELDRRAFVEKMRELRARGVAP